MPAGEVSLGLIGVGRWGRNIARTIAMTPGVKLAAVASGNPDTPGFVPPGCRIHSDWRDLMAAGDLQGVIIATPPASHAQLLVATVEAGKAVLVEKPLVASRQQASELRARLVGRSATILVDHIHLFSPAFRALEREASSLGPLRSIASGAGKPGETRGASLLWEWAPHDLAMCMTLAPGACRVTAAAGHGDTISFSLALAGGASACVELNTAKPRHRWFAASFDDGTLVYRDTGGASLVRLQPGEDVHATGTPLAFDPGLPLNTVITRFADAIRDKDHDRRSFELGLSVVDLVADIEDRLVRTDH